MLRNTPCCLFLGKLSEKYIISKKSRGSYVLHHFKCFKINDCNPSWRWTKKVKFVRWHHFWWVGIHIFIFNVSYCNFFSSRTSSFLQKKTHIIKYSISQNKRIFFHVGHLMPCIHRSQMMASHGFIIVSLPKLQLLC